MVRRKRHAAVGLGEGARVELSAITGERVCGSFDLQWMFKGEKTKLVGTFVAPLR